MWWWRNSIFASELELTSTVSFKRGWLAEVSMYAFLRDQSLDWCFKLGCLSI